jgi:hypothetical protein
MLETGGGMTTAMRLTGVLLTFVVAAHPAAAQPPPSSPDLVPRQLMPQPASNPTSGPPGTTAPTPRVASQSTERDSAFVVGSVGVGSMGLFAADLQLGWMLTPRLSVFASIGGFMVVEDEGGAVGIKGLGARLWGDRVFLEARAAAASTTTGCDFDDPCVDRTTFIGIAGAGAELLHSRGFGLELRGEIVFARHDRAFLGTLGLGFYL